MPDREPPRLSDIIDDQSSSILKPSTRRRFLANASTLSLAIPGVGAALAACSPGDNAPPDGGTTGQTATTPSGGGSKVINSNSKLDTALLRDRHHAGTSITGADAREVEFHRFAPELPPLVEGGVKLHWHASEARIRISEDTVVAAWTFEGNMPGPIVHTRVGDTVEFTLTNDVDVPHSMDFHAAQIDPKVAFRSVPKGESVTFRFTPKWAGAFMYHCGTAPVLMHIGSGMYGAIIVSPREGLPPAKEFVLIQSEMYLAEAASDVRAFDYQKMLNTMPDFVAFNGRPNQYIKEPIHVKVGDRVRFWLVNAGPTHPCNFHVVGEQFDTMYLGSPPLNPIRGVQTWNVAPGGGMCFELLCDVAGEFPFVNHGFGHGQKGAIGFLVVDR
ncbi:MAG TPA: multicopper oxidase domain-containing protein [Gemmatimonadaceae bacterium]|nr:multicopper oxidase domain-containing protein [Gemmatimonadaceae bacterium]